MNKDKLLELAGQLVLAGVTHQNEEIDKISEELAAVLRLMNDKDGGGAVAPPLQEKDVCGFLKFNAKEISQMPKSFRRTFIAEGKVICYRKRKRGKVYGGYTYEARYRRHGFNISVSAHTVEELSKRFIKALHECEKVYTFPQVPETFHEFAMYYFENFRKRKVKPMTYASDLRRYNSYLKPNFGSIPMRKIFPAQCQTLIDSCTSKGQTKTADELYSLLNVIFKMAIAHGVIERNPLAVVVKERHEREHGKALTKEEEKILLERTSGTEYQLMFAVALYTGMRPNEFATARLEGEFIVCVNSKRKNKKVEYKKIPVTPMLKPYLQSVTELKFYIPEVMREKFKTILPDHKLYDLRTTFYTRCYECGVADVARMEFVGHSLGTLGDTYTDLSDEFLLKEGRKLKY